MHEARLGSRIYAGSSPGDDRLPAPRGQERVGPSAHALRKHHGGRLSVLVGSAAAVRRRLMRGEWSANLFVVSVSGASCCRSALPDRADSAAKVGGLCPARNNESEGVLLESIARRLPISRIRIAFRHTQNRFATVSATSKHSRRQEGASVARR
jgi:hypothetical protein